MTEPGKRVSIGLDTAFDLFCKVGRDRAAVEREVTPDAVFNFVMTAHALAEWARKDPTLSPAAKESAAGLSRTNDWLLACRDLANGNKHFAIDHYPPLVQHADAITGYGVGRYGAGPYGAGEWSIKISWGGTTHEALNLVARVHEVWAAFFRDNPPQNGQAAA